MGVVADNLARVQERIVRSAERVGRKPEEIRLLGATKSVPLERIFEAVEAGLRLFGENYIQEALPKISALGSGIEWHFIGRLQRNKAKEAVEYFSMIQSVDSLRLAEALNRRAEQAGKRIPILIEVNLGEEATKGGVLVSDLFPTIEVLRKYSFLQIQGLMAIPPLTPDPEDARPYFRTLKTLFDQLDNEFRHCLSMGMSHDFEVAIEEGSTLVRLGTALFGPRPK